MNGLRRLDSRDPAFARQLDDLLRWDVSTDDGVQRGAAAVIDEVRARGDAAVLDFTRRFDRVDAGSIAELTLDAAMLERQLAAIGARERDALQAAADRIRDYHRLQRHDSFQIRDALGVVLGQRVTPLARVGLYVPGGQAAYPSSVLMTAIVARVAGVEDIVITTPTPDGVRNPLVLAAAAIAGVHRVICIGGAQAVAALAYGTESIPRVDKIVGPGGAWVAAAKRQVFGPVGIDMIAGPSEIVVISDGSVAADWIALDLFSQAEHDEAAQAILISPDRAHLDAVAASMARLLPQLPRAAIIGRSLSARGALIAAADLDDAVRIANRIAPEHLELAVVEPERWIDAVRNAGAIFLGAYTAEALGDYVAGPSHVLPTYGTARFASPLGIYDFQKRTSIIGASAVAADALGRIAAVLAEGEGLGAHARSAAARMQEP